MKNRVRISTLFLSLFLASMLLKTGHQIEHILIDSAKEFCNHNYASTSKNQITHEHEIAKECSICAFSISSFIEYSFAYFDLKNNNFPTNIGSLFHTERNIIFYIGSLFGLRAPPFLQ